jgi:hypothetical protein
VLAAISLKLLSYLLADKYSLIGELLQDQIVNFIYFPLKALKVSKAKKAFPISTGGGPKDLIS